MKISMHDMAVNTFAPMLQSLAEVLHKGAEHAGVAKLDLVNARLAPDMFTLAQQVQEACHAANDAISRLTGRGAATRETPETSFAGFKAQIARTIESVRATPTAAFAGAEDRDCSIEIPGNLVIAMIGLQLPRPGRRRTSTQCRDAYDILRHNGVEIGKKDYASQVGAFIRQKS